MNLKHSLYVSIVFVFFGQHACSPIAIHLFGEARVKLNALPESSIEVPSERSLEWQAESMLADSIYAVWAAKPFADWQDEGKVNMPRKLLGNLHTVTDIPAVNEYILELEPWGSMGSTWALH